MSLSSLTSFLLGFLFLLCTPSMGQKVLQMEKYGSAKVRKFYIGDELIYRIKGDKEWFQGVLTDIFIEEKMVLFESRAVKIEDITAFKFNRRVARSLERQLYVFGAGWALWSSIGTLVNRNYSRGDVLVTATAVGTGFLIGRLFRSKKYRFGKRRWLRVLDLTMNKWED